VGSGAWDPSPCGIRFQFQQNRQVAFFWHFRADLDPDLKRGSADPAFRPGGSGNIGYNPFNVLFHKYNFKKKINPSTWVSFIVLLHARMPCMVKTFLAFQSQHSLGIALAITYLMQRVES
jgi:hypothetical protein